MKIQGIYKIINCINNKVYIGQSIDIEKRFKRHKSNILLKFKHPLYYSLKKYGIDNFEFIIIEKVISIKDLDSKEQYWMDFYNSYNPEFGYNLRPKAESTRGYKSTEETKHKQSIAKKGRVPWNKGLKMSKEFCEKLSNSHKGQEVSKETINKIIASRKGYTHSEETKIKISLGNKGKHKEKRGRPSVETIEKIRNGNKGRVVSEDTKNKIREARKNQIITEETRKKLSEKAKLQWIRQKQLKIDNIIEFKKEI